MVRNSAFVADATFGRVVQSLAFLFGQHHRLGLSRRPRRKRDDLGALTTFVPQGIDGSHPFDGAGAAV
jgi:hypothetical protein